MEGEDMLELAMYEPLLDALVLGKCGVCTRARKGKCGTPTAPMSCARRTPDMPNLAIRSNRRAAAGAGTGAGASARAPPLSIAQAAAAVRQAEAALAAAEARLTRVEAEEAAAQQELLAPEEPRKRVCVGLSPAAQQMHRFWLSGGVGQPPSVLMDRR